MMNSSDKAAVTARGFLTALVLVLFFQVGSCATLNMKQEHEKELKQLETPLVTTCVEHPAGVIVFQRPEPRNR